MIRKKKTLKIHRYNQQHGAAYGYIFRLFIVFIFFSSHSFSLISISTGHTYCWCAGTQGENDFVKMFNREKRSSIYRIFSPISILKQYTMATAPRKAGAQKSSANRTNESLPMLQPQLFPSYKPANISQLA